MYSGHRKGQTMISRILLAIGVLVCVVVCLVLAQNAQPITGQWTVGGQDKASDKVQLTIQRTTGPNSEMSSSSPVPLAQLAGLTRAQLDGAGSVVRFQMGRDAGPFRFE